MKSQENSAIILHSFVFRRSTNNSNFYENKARKKSERDFLMRRNRKSTLALLCVDNCSHTFRSGTDWTANGPWPGNSTFSIDRIGEQREWEKVWSGISNITKAHINISRRTMWRLSPNRQHVTSLQARKKFTSSGQVERQQYNVRRTNERAIHDRASGWGGKKRENWTRNFP